MYSNIKDIIVPVNQLYGLLKAPVHLNLFKATEFSYSMIDMDYIISWI